MAEDKGRVCRHRDLRYRRCIDGHHLECDDCGVGWEWQGGPPGVLIQRMLTKMDMVSRIAQHVLDIQRRMAFTGDDLELVREVLAFVAECEDVGEMLADYTGRTVGDVTAVLDRHYGEKWWEKGE